MVGRISIGLGGLLMILASVLAWANLTLLEGTVLSTGTLSIVDSQIQNPGPAVASVGATLPIAVVVVVAGVLLVALAFVPRRLSAARPPALAAAVVLPLMVAALAVFAIVDTSWTTSQLLGLTFADANATHVLLDTWGVKTSAAPGLGVWAALGGAALGLLGGFMCFGRAPIDAEAPLGIAEPALPADPSASTDTPARG